jgi:fatty acid synthase subunit alpha, fungi type
VGDLGSQLNGMVDPDRVVVITGFGELGPYGSSRTRWEMEARGRFSLERCVEMAWVMGLIKHFSGTRPGSTEIYVGWVDSESGTPIADVDVKTKYEKRILEHSGIRLVESSLWNGYDPTRRQMLQEVVLDADLPVFESSEQDAVEFKREHGENVDVVGTAGGQFKVALKRGAVMMIPKALNAGSHVTGQLPTGWDPRRYGIPDDIISQVDRITLFTLISTSEAFLSSGITDPYEMYKYVHLAEVGNCIGTGIGGAQSLNRMHKGRFRD